MTKEEILHLGTLSRIKLSETEADRLPGEIDAILDYVKAVDRIAGADTDQKLGPVYNVFREDEVTNEPDTYADDLVAAFPEHEGRYLKVKKILNPDS